METFRFVALLFFALIGKQAVAETPLCFPQGIRLPPQVLYFYTNQNEGTRIFPVGQVDCSVTQKKIEIFNAETQQLVGFFVPEKLIQTIFNEQSLIEKTSDPVVSAFFKNLDDNINPVKFVYFLNSLIRPHEKLKAGNLISFSIGKLDSIQSRMISWDPYFIPKKHWAAKSLTYEEFIQFYADPKAKFVHVDSHENYDLPVLSNTSQYIYPLNLYQTPLNQVLLSHKLNVPLIDDPIVVVSKFQNDWRGYNTASNLFAQGFRNIYWLRNSMSIWRNTLKDEVLDFYLKDYEQVSNQGLYEILKSGSPTKFLDISDPNFYEQVHLKNSVSRVPVFLEPQGVQNLAKKTLTPDEYKKFTRESVSLDGKYYIADAKTLFPSSSQIVLITNSHYEGSIAAKSIYRQLVSLGHKVQILSTNTGSFLSFLKNQNLLLTNAPQEKNSFFLKFEQKKDYR